MSDGMCATCGHAEGFHNYCMGAGDLCGCTHFDVRISNDSNPTAAVAPLSDAQGPLTDEEAARKLVADYALGNESLHANWRCGYPDTYGPCNCVDEFVADVVALLRSRVRAASRTAWEECCRGFAWALDNGPDDMAIQYVKDHNPYDDGTDHAE